MSVKLINHVPFWCELVCFYPYNLNQLNDLLPDLNGKQYKSYKRFQ